MDADAVIADAARAKAGGAQRFCMGAAWRDLKDRDVPKVAAMIAGVKALGMETCATLGMLTPDQAQALKAAGLDYYNHNLDTAPEDYGRIVTTHSFDDRLETLSHVRAAGMKVCCGGIVGMNETRADRVGLLHSLATLPEHPESLPVNALVPIPGTPLGDSAPLDPLEFVRTIAVARLVCPKARVRIAAGREGMSRELQALCFLAGANSIFVGAKLLTTPLPGLDKDSQLLADLGLRPAGVEERARETVG
ncbi:MAG: biotin synthase BioB, partial [Alphaproteobacteria bacterium]|nr:biotin synthase BioB [Alphaproteobacteria bacterium]